MCQRAPKRIQNGQKRPFSGRKRIWWLPRQPFLTCETVSLHRPGCALTCSTYIPRCFYQFTATRPDYGTKMAILGHLGPPNGTPDPKNGSNASLGMCPDLFHLYSTLLRQSGATRCAYGRKRPFLAVLDPVWQPSGTPRWTFLTRETVPMHHRGCALTCSS